MYGGKGGFFNGNCLGCGRHGHRVADCPARRAYEVNIEEPATKTGEIGSVSVEDWYVFGVDVEGKEKGWEVDFAETNLFEALEFEDPPNKENEDKAENGEIVSEKTQLTIGAFMKIKKKQAGVKKKKRRVSKYFENAVPDEPADDSEKIKATDFRCVECNLGPMEINAIEGEQSERKKQKGKVTIDSGAEVSIWPATHVAWENVKPTHESEMGIGFVAANGSRMPNYGGTQVKFKKNGTSKTMNFEVTDCKKPLASVAKIVDKGNRVVFDAEESYILNKATGEKIQLERERGTFVMVVEFEVDENQWSDSSFFRRHG